MSDMSPPTPPIPADLSSDPKQAKALAKAHKAHAKALRPWFKKKRIIIPLGLAAIIGISVATGGGGDDKTATVAPDEITDTVAPDEVTETTVEASQTLFPGRPDAQKDDQERTFGDSAKLSGYTATVTSAEFQQTLSSFEDGGYMVIEVTIENRDDKAQSYSPFDWRLQTPAGQVIDPSFSSVQTLDSGDLITGGKVSGKVVFEVGTTKGDFFIIYKPDPFDNARGIWKVTLS